MGNIRGISTSDLPCFLKKGNQWTGIDVGSFSVPTGGGG